MGETPGYGFIKALSTTPQTPARKRQEEEDASRAVEQLCVSGRQQFGWSVLASFSSVRGHNLLTDPLEAKQTLLHYYT